MVGHAIPLSRSYIAHFSFNSVNISMTDDKNIAKIFVSPSKVLYWLFRIVMSVITLTQWIQNTDNFASDLLFFSLFFDTGTFGEQKQPLPNPITVRHLH